MEVSQMYYPYLRGKQFELIALREMITNGTLTTSIVPIIEPVKASSTLKTVLQLFGRESHSLAVIQNPQATPYTPFANDEEVDELKQEPFFIPAVIGTSQEAVDTLGKYNSPNSMVVLPKTVHPELEWESQPLNNAIKVIAPDNRSFLRRSHGSRVVVLDDAFTKRPRNVDYANNEDEFFSETHMYYSEDGYIGFSDYSVIGSEYIDSGYAPRAVAIHIVYFRADGQLRIRHFVSTTNDDITNVAGKFAEALEAFMQWYQSPEFNRDQNDSTALVEFKRMYDQQQYSGLGVVKKLSIEHHLEIMGRYLNERAHS
jgi:hypothetical protein